MLSILQRWLGFAVFVVAHMALIGVSYALLWLPIQQAFTRQGEAVVARSNVLARYTGIIAQENAVIAYAKEVKDRNSKGELLEAQNEGVANANLQARLKGVAESSGVQVRSVRALPTRAVGAMPFIGARLEVSGTLVAVQALVHSLESGTPTLLISSAILRPTQLGRPAEKHEEPRIDGQLDIFGGLLLRDRP